MLVFVHVQLALGRSSAHVHWYELLNPCFPFLLVPTSLRPSYRWKKKAWLDVAIVFLCYAREILHSRSEIFTFSLGVWSGHAFQAAWPPSSQQR
jgi:hypothetical protein